MVAHHWVIGASVGIYLVFWSLMSWFNRGAPSLYFDPQDFQKYENGGGRELPVSAMTGTFEPMLKHYISVTQLVITISAASITFGGNQSSKTGIGVAKFFLAFSIFYGVLFCATILYRYDEYNQNVRSYTHFWYSTVEALGFSTLACFMLGYAVWALTSFQ